MVFRRYVLPDCDLSFYFLTGSFADQKFLLLIKSNLSILKNLCIALLALYLKTHLQTQAHLAFLLCYNLKVL